VHALEVLRAMHGTLTKGDRVRLLLPLLGEKGGGVDMDSAAGTSSGSHKQPSSGRSSGSGEEGTGESRRGGLKGKERDRDGKKNTNPPEKQEWVPGNSTSSGVGICALRNDHDGNDNDDDDDDGDGDEDKTHGCGGGLGELDGINPPLLFRVVLAPELPSRIRADVLDMLQGAVEDETFFRAYQRAQHRSGPSSPSTTAAARPFSIALTECLVQLRLFCPTDSDASISASERTGYSGQGFSSIGAWDRSRSGSDIHHVPAHPCMLKPDPEVDKLHFACSIVTFLSTLLCTHGKSALSSAHDRLAQRTWAELLALAWAREVARFDCAARRLPPAPSPWPMVAALMQQEGRLLDLLVSLDIEGFSAMPDLFLQLHSTLYRIIVWNVALHPAVHEIRCDLGSIIAVLKSDG